jgi:hypothetical protein
VGPFLLLPMAVQAASSLEVLTLVQQVPPEAVLAVSSIDLGFGAQADLGAGVLCDPAETVEVLERHIQGHEVGQRRRVDVDDLPRLELRPE